MSERGGPSQAPWTRQAGVTQWPRLCPRETIVGDVGSHPGPREGYTGPLKPVVAWRSHKNYTS